MSVAELDSAARFEIIAEGDEGKTCIVLRTFEGTPEWQLSFSIDDNKPPSLANQDQMQEIQSTVEQKDQRISELESQIDELDSSGEVAIPLVDTGTQEMTLVHGDTTEEVAIDVQPQEDQNQQDQQDEQNQQDTPTTGADGPGFGIVTAVIALLTGTFLLRRYR